MRWMVLAAVVLGVIGLSACSGLAERGEDAGGKRLKVVATVGMIGDVVREVAGERAEVSVLIGEGVDPHLYRATRSDLAKVLGADAVFYNGLHLEGRMTEALEKGDGSQVVVAVAEGIDPSLILTVAGTDAGHDPHVWMDPSAWAQTVGVIRDALVELDPEGKAVYEANAAAYAAKLDELDAYAERVLSSVPEGQRVLVTAHDAFGYFGRRYGFEVVGIQGISTESEAGMRDIERLVSLLVEREIGAVFVESTVSERNVRSLIDGAAARGHTVLVGGELFSDAMGEAGAYEGTYIGMIDHNVTTIARALGGEAPEGGLNGRLLVGGAE
ncbi:MAG: metal ABC transporter solute-binding protein, Zn/Mn family [Phycisphaerales bacterium JB050]